MPTTTTPRAASRRPVAVAPALDHSRAALATAGADDLPTVRALGHDLVTVLLLRGRRHARWWRTVLRAGAAVGAQGWRCVAEVALILLMSCALAWLAWDSTAEQREAQGSRVWSVEGRLEGSLADTDVTAELEVQRRPASRDAAGARDAGASATTGPSDGSPSALGGWFLSFAAVSAVLLAGTGAAVLVVRRHRRRTDAPPESVVEQVGEDLPDLLPRDEPEEAADDALSVPDDGDQLSVVGAPVQASAVAAASTTSTASPASPLGSSGTGLPGGESTVVVGAAAPSRFEARERLFERRSAPRVDYVQPGVMVWHGEPCDMTVRDLSGTGLRLRVPATTATPLPAQGDYVTVEFPVDGGQARITAQIAWRRTVPEGVELGVVFRPLAAEDDARIRETCAARI